MPEHSRTPLVLVVVVVLVLLPFLWMGAMGSMMGPWMMGGGLGGPWWGVLSLVFGLLVAAGGGLLVLWAMPHLGRDAGGHGREALEILKERYARGELSHEQHEQMRRNLE